MARRILLSLLICSSAGAAWYLRGRQLSFSFVGLPGTANGYGWALWGLLGAAALLILLLSLPEKSSRPLSAFRTVAPGSILQGAGALLVTAGGAWQLSQLYPALQSVQAISAAAMLLGGLGLFGGAAFFLGGRRRGGGLLLLSLCAAGLYLVLTYLEVAPDPLLFRFDMRMLAIGAASLALVCLCSLLFSAGGTRRFLFFSAVTVPLSVSALYTADSFPQALGLMGCALAALGFFLSVLFGVPDGKGRRYEVVDDPFRTGSVRREELRQAEAERAAAAPAAEPSPTEKAAASVPAEDRPPAAAPAAPSAPQPEKEEDFDLARVDRLLRELGAEETEG